jgi:lysophospholipase L1-like esterase
MKLAILISDSISKGVTDGEAKDLWPNVYMANYDTHIINLGVTGARICDYTEDDMPLAAAIPWGINNLRVPLCYLSCDGYINHNLILAIGHNDTRGYDDIKSELNSFLRYAKTGLRQNVIVITPVSGQNADAVRDAATEVGVFIVEGSTLVDTNNSDYFTDGVHLSVAGHLQYANNLFNAICGII